MTRNYLRKAFTLVELLIVITIIAMLATMTLLVVGSAQRSSRIAATEATIARIDTAICELYETYSNRRIEGNTPQERLERLWDTMRMEMPCSWEEVIFPPQTGVADPPLRRVYMRAFEQAVRTAAKAQNMSLSDDHNVFDLTPAYDDKDELYPVYDTVRNHESAKLLYQIVMNGNPEAREMFGERGVAIPDGDGLPCFVDAWGRPIRYLRWAPGFAGSNRQPDLWKWTGGSPNHSNNENVWKEELSPDVLRNEYFQEYSESVDKKTALSELWDDYENKKAVQWGDAFRLPYDPSRFFSRHRNIFETLLKYPDPLDVAKVRNYDGTNVYSSRPGFFLVPLICSAGPDGKWNFTTPDGEGLENVIRNPFQRGWGAPFDSDGGELDNIHNHRLGGR